jgi:tetratricopeptide (TPR) repeat protein
MRARRLVAAVLLAALACAAHEKAGDRASAVGDWKTAEREYARAVQDDPKDQELRAKYQEARAHALVESQAHARACAAGQDWECALAESQYALGLDPGLAEMAVLRHDAGREAGRQRVRGASAALERREYARAMELLESVRLATDDAGVAAEAARVTPAVVRGATGEAERLRGQLQYPAAIDLLSRAARLDPAVQPRLAAVRAEYERWKDAEAERLALEGDALLDSRRFAEAKARYDQAVALRPQGRAAPLARYAGLLAEGEAAVARRDFDAAERAYGAAVRGGSDSGLAREALDRVQVRLWAVRLRSVRVTRGGGDLVLAVTLPDGRAAQTPPRFGAYGNLESSFVVAANAYDERAVTLRVFRGPPERPLDLGALTVPVADLVARRGVVLSAGPIAELRVDCDPADLPEGAVTGLLPVPDRDNHAPAFSVATPRSAGYRVTAVRASLGVDDRGLDEGSAVRVELEQRGAPVLRTPRQPSTALELRPAALYLYAEDREPLVLRLVREGRGGPRVVLTQPLAGADLARGRLTFSTTGGSTLELSLDRLRGRREP